jgi:hypothetical protein
MITTRKLHATAGQEAELETALYLQVISPKRKPGVHHMVSCVVIYRCYMHDLQSQYSSFKEFFLKFKTATEYGLWFVLVPYEFCLLWACSITTDHQVVSNCSAIYAGEIYPSV